MSFPTRSLGTPALTRWQLGLPRDRLALFDGPCSCCLDAAPLSPRGWPGRLVLRASIAAGHRPKGTPRAPIPGGNQVKPELPAGSGGASALSETTRRTLPRARAARVLRDR